MQKKLGGKIKEIFGTSFIYLFICLAVVLIIESPLRIWLYILKLKGPIIITTIGQSATEAISFALTFLFPAEFFFFLFVGPVLMYNLLAKESEEEDILAGLLVSVFFAIVLLSLISTLIFYEETYVPEVISLIYPETLK